MQWEWNDGLESRSRKPACVVVLPDGTAHRFTGTTIPGVAEVVSEKYQKNGKWSSTTYTVLSPEGSRIASWSQSWEEGLYFPQAYWHEVLAWLREVAPQISLAQVQELLRREWPKAAAKLDGNQEAAERLGGATQTQTLIVTRHAGMVEWLRQNGYTGVVMPQVTQSDVRGKIVVGVLPLHLAALAAEIVTVDMPSLTSEQRGRDLTPAEMDAAGAAINRYVVRRVMA